MKVCVCIYMGTVSRDFLIKSCSAKSQITL